MGEERGVEPVAVDRHRGHPHALGREGRPGLGVAGVLERDGGADQAEGSGEGAQRGADPRHDEQVVGLDGDAPAAAQVFGEHAAQAGVGRPGAGVVARHHRAGRAPRPAPRGRVDERGVGPSGAQVPARLLAGAAFRSGVGAARGVHVRHGAGGRCPVRTRSDDRSRPGSAHDETCGGQLVVRRDDRPTGQPQRRGQARVDGSASPGRSRPARSSATTASAMRWRSGAGPGRHVEGEVDGAGGARHPSTILVQRNRWLLDLGEGQLIRWTGRLTVAGRPSGAVC